MVQSQQTHRPPLRPVLDAYVNITAAAYTAKAGDRMIGVNRAGAVTITLPTAQLRAGRTYTIKDESGAAASNNITVATEGSETIDGSAIHTISDNYGSKTYYSDGANWFTVPLLASPSHTLAYHSAKAHSDLTGIGAGDHHAQSHTLDSHTGTLQHEKGGMEADVNAGDGFVQIKSGATTVIKSNAAATAAPGVTDDTNAGYAVGSVWIDTTNDKAYVCLDASAGAAVWTETTQAGGAGGAVTFEGGQTTEATTTSTVPVDLLSSDTLSIATTLPVEFFVAMRKTSGAAAVGAIGLKVNTTVTGEATDGDPITLARTGSTNAASSRYAWGVLGPRITLYSDSSFVQRTADGVDTVSLGGLLHNTADLPEATITAIVIRGKVSSASITLGADELDVYSRSAA